MNAVDSQKSARVVLIHPDRDKALLSIGDSGSIKFVGGRLQEEEDPKKGALREVLEETGLDLGELGLPLTELPDQVDERCYSAYWYGSVLSREALNQITAGGDVVSLDWVPFAQIVSELTYQSWREFWSTMLLPALLESIQSLE